MEVAEGEDVSRDNLTVNASTHNSNSVCDNFLKNQTREAN